MIVEFNYDYLKELKKGQNTSVYLCQEKTTNLRYALKVVETSKMNQNELSLFENEKKVLRNVSTDKNRNIIELIKILKHPFNGEVYVILEYCNGGTLRDYLNNYIKKNGKPFPEDLVRFLMKQILSGVNYLHRKGIVHNNLRLSNILLKYNNTNDLPLNNIFSAEIKIISFKSSFIQTYSNSIALPNILPTFRINYEKDINALGALCCEMLFGKKLFDANNIYNTNVYLPNTISDKARNFIYLILRKDGLNTVSAAQLLNHEFINTNTNEFNHHNNIHNNININNNNNNNNINNYNYRHIRTINSARLNPVNINNTDEKTNIFFKDSNGKLTVVVANKNDKIKDLIQLFYCKINKYGLNKKIYFVYNNINLESIPNKTIKEMKLINVPIRVIYSDF